MPAPTIKLHDAIHRMRDLTRRNIPFSFSFISYSEKLRTSNGLCVVDNALLRAGYREDQSDKHNTLVAYTNLNDESSRHFYYPLLMTFNDYIIEI